MLHLGLGTMKIIHPKRLKPHLRASLWVLLKLEEKPRQSFFYLPLSKQTLLSNSLFTLLSGFFFCTASCGKVIIAIKFGIMVIASRLLANFSGLVHPSYNKPSQFQRYQRNRFNYYKPNQSVFRKNSSRSFARKPSTSRHVMFVGSDRHQLSFGDELPEEPFLLSLVRETIWGLRSLFQFLVEQPSQLKYIEWPSFQSTLKTAILTLVLVAGLIVALSSVDSALCYVLALLLRRTPS